MGVRLCYLLPHRSDQDQRRTDARLKHAK